MAIRTSLEPERGLTALPPVAQPSGRTSNVSSHTRAPSWVSRAPSMVSRAPSAKISRGPSNKLSRSQSTSKQHLVARESPSRTSRTPSRVSRAPSKFSHKYSASMDSWLEDEIYNYYSTAEPPPKLTFRERSRRFLSGMYGSEPAGPEIVENMDGDPDTVYPKGWRLILLLLSGALPYVVAVIDDTIIATIIPVLVNEFHAPAEIGWYASAYFLPLTIFMPLVGKCYSLWKIKWFFFGSLSTLLIGSIICATAKTSSAFIAGRVISGTGAAGIINGAMRIIGVSSDRSARTYLEATGALFMGVCTVSGPILGGVISVHWGWRWAFWINVPIAGSALIVIALIFPAEANQAAYADLSIPKKILRLDPIGTTALIVGLICAITLLQNVSTSIVFTAVDGALAAISGIMFIVFFAQQFFVRPDLALIPRNVIKHRAVWGCCSSLFMLFAGWMNFVFFLSVFFQTVYGDSAEKSAFNLLPYVVSVSLAAAATGVAVSFVRYYNPMFILGGICFATGAGLIMLFDEHTKLGTRICYEALMGVGVGFCMLANVAPCQTFLDEKDHSVANGLTFFSSLLGATIALPISNTLFNRTLLKKVENLDLPPMVKLLILIDPTKIRENTPEEQLPAVIQALVESVRTTFVLGLVFAILSAILFLTVPWKPLIVVDHAAQARRSRALDLRFSQVNYYGAGRYGGFRNTRAWESRESKAAWEEIKDKDFSEFKKKFQDYGP